MTFFYYIKQKKYRKINASVCCAKLEKKPTPLMSFNLIFKNVHAQSRSMISTVMV